jgi:hypothetical protein
LKILFVGFPYSIHAARWASLLNDTGWDIHLFPSQTSNALHKNFAGVTFWPTPDIPFENEGFVNLRVGTLKDADLSKEVVPSNESAHVERLVRVMDQERFDVVHSMEFQHAGYLTRDAIDRVKQPAPIWIATNYGADIAHFGKDPAHEQKIRRILERCDYYSSECKRDLKLARKLGLRGKPFTTLPNSGGIDISEMTRFRQPGK